MKGLYVREYKIRKGLLSRKLSADFRCPNKKCAATLSCGHDEIGKKDRCPNCGQPFALTKEPLSAFLEQEEQNATERERLKLEKETARRELKREKEELAQQRAAEKEKQRREKEYDVVEYVEDEGEEEPWEYEREHRRDPHVSIHVDERPAVHGCVVALCSFFVPGLGQLVQGRVLVALLIFGSVGLMYLFAPLTLTLTGWIGLAIQFFGIIEAVVNNPPLRGRVETHYD